VTVEPRMRPVMAGGRCLGHVISSARGYAAHDAKDALIGTYASAEQAIAAVAGQAERSSGNADTG
jgi:hypothetical protein